MLRGTCYLDQCLVLWQSQGAVEAAQTRNVNRTNCAASLECQWVLQVSRLTFRFTRDAVFATAKRFKIHLRMRARLDPLPVLVDPSAEANLEGRRRRYVSRFCFKADSSVGKRPTQRPPQGKRPRPQMSHLRADGVFWRRRRPLKSVSGMLSARLCALMHDKCFGR